MANDFSSTPLIVDTAMTVTYQNSSPPNNLSIYPKIIYWFNPITIADTFVINDANGKLLFTGRCEVANQSQYFSVSPDTKWRDFKVATLASGTLYIYFKT